MIDARVKALFFDRPSVMAAVDTATRKVLTKFGAYVRQSARQSIRKGKGSAAPGKPPKSHKGFLRSGIAFQYEPHERNVVIGPTPLPGSNIGIAPPLLEYGGDTVRVRKTRHGRKAGTYHYRGNPFMNPAFKKEKEARMPEMWADSVK